MFLKNENYLLVFFITVFFLLFFKSVLGKDEEKGVLIYLKSLKNFSASFIQNDGINLSEGKVYIGEKRVRAEYLTPTKILIVLDSDKAMYYNYDLEEDEFFDPKNTNAWFFYDIFRNPDFFKDSSIKEKNNELIIEKNGVDDDQRNFKIKVYFEKKPLVLRSVEVIIDNQFLKLSIYNHTYDEKFDKNFFKLINPKFFN
tara:strand:+ start:2410 stop:3006 length:597 start_codon:yes stop_codon:yes gene_type:complete